MAGDLIGKYNVLPLKWKLETGVLLIFLLTHLLDLLSTMVQMLWPTVLIKDISLAIHSYKTDVTLMVDT